jgi:two-component system response regulator
MPDPIEIVLVEDDPSDVKLALHAFAKHNLVNRVVVARDGEEALECLFRTRRYAHLQGTPPPRLVLLDLKLPLVDGLEVLRRLKADPATRAVPVVVLTSSSEERDLVESYALGVNSYIQKPVDFDSFVDVVRQVGLYWLLVNRAPP